MNSPKLVSERTDFPAANSNEFVGVRVAAGSEWVCTRIPSVVEVYEHLWRLRNRWPDKFDAHARRCYGRSSQIARKISIKIMETGSSKHFHHISWWKLIRRNFQLWWKLSLMSALGASSLNFPFKVTSFPFISLKIHSWDVCDCKLRIHKSSSIGMHFIKHP